VHTTETLIIGGGQAGLAVSRCLTELGHEHLVLERGQVAERWRSERWDSLRLLTPNWMTRLPGFAYDGPDPDGFMTAAEVTELFGRYAATFDAPVRAHTNVRRLSATDAGFAVTTDDDVLTARNVVIATGWCDRPAIPAIARCAPASIHQMAPSDYRRPTDLPPGNVLVVGASATGIQLADELRRDGRQVTIAVGSHSRMPRTYRGMDVFWWLDQIAAFDRTIDDVVDAHAARFEPSLQLVGRPDRATLDVAALRAAGVRLAGRLVAFESGRARFGHDLGTVLADADRAMHRTLDRIDIAIAGGGLTAEVDAPDRPMSVAPTDDAPDQLDLARAAITSIVWATGFRRNYDWLDLPIVDAAGEIAQRRGVTPMPGAYVLGQRFQHFRNSNFIDGVGRDAAYVATHIVASSIRRPTAGRLVNAGT
jgi:putative flavoprotein involved in K+ transport